jgi:hypothetical protein
MARGTVCTEEAMKMDDETHYLLRSCKGANSPYINKILKVRGYFNNYKYKNRGRNKTRTPSYFHFY